MSAPVEPDRRPTRHEVRETIARRRDRAVVAQVAPSATTATTLYTVPNKYSAKGTVHVCERGGAAATFRIALRPDGATLDPKHYLVYDAPLAANEDAHTAELDSLDETDVLTVYASSANLTFQFIGREEPKP